MSTPRSDPRAYGLPSLRPAPPLRVPEAWRKVEPPLRDPRTVVAFRGQNGNRKLMVPHLRPPAQITPGVHSTSPDMRAFALDLARTATKEYPRDVREDGFAGETGVTGDFSALLSCSGCQMTPASAPPVNRDRLLQERGLSLDFQRDRDEAVFRTTHRLMFGKRVAGANMRFSSVSSTSNPFFEFEVPWKKQMILKALDNADAVLDAVERDDLETLYREYGMCFMSTLVKRLQAEGGEGLFDNVWVPKPRTVASAEYALSGGRKGALLVADKRFAIRPWVPDSMSHAHAMRVRTAWGYGGAVTYFLTACLSGVREHYYAEYGFTWHHTTPEQISGKIADAHTILGADVTQMDQLYPDFLMDAHARWLADYFHPSIAKMEQWVNWSPYYAPQLGPGIKPYWAGDPRDLSTFTIRAGLNSGRASNPDLGKWGMTCAYMCMLADIEPDILTFKGDMEASIAAFLKGEHPGLALLDMADDALFIIKKGSKAEAYALQLGKVLRGGKGSPYFAIGYEDGIAFLGNVLRRDKQGITLTPVPNPITYLVNGFCPEHGVESEVHRPYHGWGTLAREEHYMRSPIVRELSAMVNTLWMKHFSATYPTPLAVARDHARARSPDRQADETYIDTLVRLNPDMLHYRFQKHEVSQHILDLTTSSVDGDILERTIGKYLPPTT